MANNCQLVRRARRKWYRRLTDKCNMHDRHSGVGVEVPAVYVEVQKENRAQPAADLNADVSCAEVRVTFGTLNMQVKNLDEGFQDILCKCDILCLQEVTPSCVEDLLQIARSHGYEVATAMGRGSVSAEPFDVCMLQKTATIRKLRMSVSPLAPESPRRLLAVQVQLRGNGAILAVGTVHLTASPEGQPQRLAELESALCTLQALQVNGQLLVGDLNMQRDKDLTTTGSVQFLGGGLSMQLLPAMLLCKRVLPYWLAGQQIAESWKNGCKCCARAWDRRCAGDQAPKKNALSSGELLTWHGNVCGCIGLSVQQQKIRCR